MIVACRFCEFLVFWQFDIGTVLIVLGIPCFAVCFPLFCCVLVCLLCLICFVVVFVANCDLNLDDCYLVCLWVFVGLCVFMVAGLVCCLFVLGFVFVVWLACVAFGFGFL